MNEPVIVRHTNYFNSETGQFESSYKGVAIGVMKYDDGVYFIVRMPDGRYGTAPLRHCEFDSESEKLSVFKNLGE